MTFILPNVLITIDLNVFSEALKVHSRINNIVQKFPNHMILMTMIPTRKFGVSQREKIVE